MVSFNHPNFNVLRELGRGGNATVYLAVQLSLNRRVAVKVMHPGGWLDAAQKARFLREGRIVAKLNHPHIVPVYEVGEAADGSLFMVMEYLSHGTLANADELTLADLRRIVEQLCAALAFSHEQGIVHRDVKPENVLFKARDHAMLGDFGIARAADSATQMTVTGTMIGTPDYMSPEQVSGGALDGRSDLYSLGVLIYEQLAGYRPLEGDSMMATGLQHLTVAPRPLPDNVAALQPLMDQLLAKQADERTANAADVVPLFTEALDASGLDESVLLSSLHAGERPERVGLDRLLTSQSQTVAPRPRWPWLAGALAATVGVGALWFGGASGTGDEPASPTGVPNQPPEVAQPIDPEPTPLERTLAKADEAFRLDRWFGNDDADAVPLYRSVLELAPEEPTALARLDAMLRTSVARVQRRIDEGRLSAAEQQLKQLRVIWSEAPTVDELAVSLANARSERNAAAAASRTAAEVRSLIARAGQAQAERTYIAPDGQGALQLFAKALALDASSDLARSGVDQVLLSLRSQLQRDMDANRFDEADALFAQAEQAIKSLTLEAPELLAMGQQLTQARAEHLELARQAEAASVLRADIDQYLARAREWLNDAQSQVDLQYSGLNASLAQLLRRAPGDDRLLAMQQALRTRADQIERAQKEAEQEAEEAVRPPISF